MGRDTEDHPLLYLKPGETRFRATNIVLERAIELKSVSGYMLARSSTGSVFVGSRTSLYQIDNGKPPRLLRAGIDNPQSICESADGSVYFGAERSMMRLKDGA